MALVVVVGVGELLGSIGIILCFESDSFSSSNPINLSSFVCGKLQKN